MGFASSAADYTETRLSLDSLCKTHAPGVFMIRSEAHSVREGIKPGALLIVDYDAQPVDGSLVLCVMENVFMIKRLRLYPALQLQDLVVQAGRTYSPGTTRTASRYGEWSRIS